jgi:penicillin-binding protein 2
MTLITRSPISIRFAFILSLLLIFSFSETALGKRRAASTRSKASRVQKKSNKKASASNRRSRGRRRSTVARSRRGRTRQLSARQLRRQRQQMAREQSSALKALQRRLRRPPTKRERAAELRRIEARYRRDREAARRRAEAARRAAIARQMAIEKAMRDEAQTFISRDDVAGEDPEVRRVAVNALGNHAGTVVVMDPMTGRIYTAVNQEWAFRRGFKPCSTIKLVTGLAGLNEKVIETTDTTPVSDRYRIDLTDALAYSNNTFFQQVSNKIGFDKMVSYARVMGLGQKTGVNVSNEYAGHLPDDSNRISLLRMGSHGDDFEVTPLQLATLVSAMSNGGTLLAPYIPKTSPGETKSNAKVRSQIPIEPEYLRRMVPGMVGAVNYGSGKKAYDPMQTVAGKTGTCISNGAWIGLFTSYAPLANPRLAVVVIARGSDGRRHFPAAVAGQIYRELGSRFGTPINVQLATAPADGSTDTKAAELNEEEKDADDAEAAELESAEQEAEAQEAKGTTATTTTSPAAPVSQPRNSNVKQVLKTIERHNPEPQKTNKSTTTPSTKPTTATQPDARARRVNP